MGDTPSNLGIHISPGGNCLQEERWNSHTPYLASVDIIEALTGLDFLSALSDDIEEAIESMIQKVQEVKKTTTSRRSRADD